MKEEAIKLLFSEREGQLICQLDNGISFLEHLYTHRTLRHCIKVKKIQLTRLYVVLQVVSHMENKPETASYLSLFSFQFLFIFSV